MLEKQKEIEQVVIEITVDIKPETEVLTTDHALSLDLEELQQSFVHDEITLEDLEIETQLTEDNHLFEEEYADDLDAFTHIDEIDLDFDETLEY